MKKTNQNVRDILQKKRIFQWEIAEKLGLHDSNFTRLLRKELTEEMKIKVFAAISEIEAERMQEIN